MSSDQHQLNDDKIDSILGAALTGGQSRRMGRDKALIVVEDQPLAARAVTVLGEVFGEVVVISNGKPAHSEFGARVVKDIYQDCGPLGGLHAALRAAGSAEAKRGVFLLACDMPFVSSELVRFLVTAEDIGRSDEAWARVPRMNDRVEPLCAVYSGGCLESATEALEAGSFKMREFLGGLMVEIVEITRELPFFDWNLFSNVNRPGDLLQICEQVDRVDQVESTEIHGSSTPTEVKA